MRLVCAVMDDFERGAREMQRVAAEAMDAIVAQAEDAMSKCSRGQDHAYMWNRLQEKRLYYIECAKLIRSISIEGAINAVVGDER